MTAGFGQRLSRCLCSAVVHLHCQSMVAPCKVRILPPLDPQKKRPTFIPRMTPAVRRGAPRENAALCRNPSRSDQFYVPEFAELTLVVLVAQKGHDFSHARVQFPGSRHPQSAACANGASNFSSSRTASHTAQALAPLMSRVCAVQSTHRR